MPLLSNIIVSSFVYKLDQVHEDSNIPGGITYLNYRSEEGYVENTRLMAVLTL